MKIAPNENRQSTELRMMKRHLVRLLVIVALLFSWSAASLAEIAFDEVTVEAGIHHSGTTYGASWGDFNGDGWPDLWVSNHNSKPTLYLNRQDGTFSDIIDRVWTGDPKADTHGAAWADFDNDGDQDLIEVVDFEENQDGTLNLGFGKNHLFINDNGSLVERAAEYGLAANGMARMPLWFDANRDGFLDLLVVNTRGKNQPGSTLYLQKDHRFEAANEDFQFKDRYLNKTENILGRLYRLMAFKYPSRQTFWAQGHLEFAQLGDLSSNKYIDLLFYSMPTRIYTIQDAPFKEITYGMGFPDITGISDAAVADFNGDQKLDLYIAHGTYMPSDAIQTRPGEIKGYITCYGAPPKGPKAVSFGTEDDVIFQIFPEWLPLSRIFIGSGGKHPSDRTFTLSPLDSDTHGPVDPETKAFEGASISYDPEKRSWIIQNFHPSIFVDFVAKSESKITNFKTIGFNRFEENGKDSLFFQKNKEFVEKPLAGAAGAHTSCYFVTSGDFDNDMDIDLYLTCTGPVENLPNRLLENDGMGNFSLIPGAGGAAGSQFGRGDVVVTADYDMDGCLDLFITNGHDPTSPLTEKGPHQLFRNQGNDNHWIEIDLEGVESNRDGIGARVELEANKIIQIRDQSGGMHRITQNHQRLHFGLGKHSRVDRITVAWPSGIVQHLNNVGADQILHIKESSQVAK